MQQVFAAEFYRDCSETIDFWAITDVPSTSISAVVESIGKLFPLNYHFNHLKRIHANTILICPNEPEKLREEMDKLLVVLGERNLLTERMDLRLIKVPRYPVLTKAQYDTANAIWPIRVTTPLTEIHNDVDEIAKEKVLNKLKRLAANDQRDGRSCLLIESPNGDISVKGKGEDPASSFHFRHAALNAADEIGKQSDYLATDFSVYSLGEPCVMCSMALLHSRVKEVWFFHNPKRKLPFHGLGSTVAVHCHKQLNHRFNVYRVIVNDSSNHS